MAKRIEAIKAYRLWLNRRKIAGEERFMKLVTQHTTLSPGAVKMRGM